MALKESNSRRSIGNEDLVEIIKPSQVEIVDNKKGENKLSNAVVDNMDKIFNIASDIVEIGKMRERTNESVKIMEEQRKYLLSEAQAYVERKNADTNSIVSKMNIIREMTQDFYKCTNTNITADDFNKIISSVIMEMREN